MKVVSLNKSCLQRAELKRDCSKNDSSNLASDKECSLSNIPYYPCISFGATPTEEKIQAYMERLQNINPKTWVPDEDPANPRAKKCINNPIAEKGLAFLDSLNNYEKRIFVDKYKEMTGFPDLDMVNRNIRNEVADKIFGLAKLHDFKPLYAGFVLSCSGGIKKALPGSDLDGLSFLIDTKKPLYAGYYRYLFGESVNQLILETGANHYPEVISLQELAHFIGEAEKSFQKEKFSEAELKRFQDNIEHLENDNVIGAEFNRRIAQNINNENHSDDPKQYKYDFLAVCQLIENYRQNGYNTIYDNMDDKTKKLIEKSCLYKYSNITQQALVSKRKKDKIKFREEFLKDFNDFSVQRQFEIIKAMIHRSYSITSPDEDETLKKLFANSGNMATSLDSLELMYKILTEGE